MWQLLWRNNVQRRIKRLSTGLLGIKEFLIKSLHFHNSEKDSSSVGVGSVFGAIVGSVGCWDAALVFFNSIHGISTTYKQPLNNPQLLASQSHCRQYLIQTVLQAEVALSLRNSFLKRWLSLEKGYTCICVSGTFAPAALFSGETGLNFAHEEICKLDCAVFFFFSVWSALSLSMGQG